MEVSELKTVVFSPDNSLIYPNQDTVVANKQAYEAAAHEYARAKAIAEVAELELSRAESDLARTREAYSNAVQNHLAKDPITGAKQ
jgi:hypothetical protein